MFRGFFPSSVRIHGRAITLAPEAVQQLVALIRRRSGSVQQLHQFVHRVAVADTALGLFFYLTPQLAKSLELGLAERRADVSAGDSFESRPQAVLEVPMEHGDPSERSQQVLILWDPRRHLKCHFLHPPGPARGRLPSPVIHLL